MLTSVEICARAIARAHEADRPPEPPRNSLRNAYFGELHLHTKYSFDAFIDAPRDIDPDLAYRFAKGETVRYQSRAVKRRWPLDFAAVTDHAEYLGVLCDLEDMGSALSRTALGRGLRASDPEARAEVWKAFLAGNPLPEPSVQSVSTSAWQSEIDAANRNYHPGVFTTFIGYEWTSFGDIRTGPMPNLHRNIIFRGDAAPLPFTALDSTNPEDLWSYLEENRQRGIEALAIPHNANWSEGLMYDWLDQEGKLIDREYASRRVLNEPLSEIYQTKGQSETTPLLAPADEFAGFEVIDEFLKSAAGTKGQDGHGSSIREAYGRGLVLGGKIGVNPYKFGVVAGSDFHNGLSTSDEDAFSGALYYAHGGVDPTQDYYLPEIRQRMLDEEKGIHTEFDYNKESGSGGLTGVWAEENTRESIYAALRRKETFATSGTRIKVRFFGGWKYPRTLDPKSMWLKMAYALGTPMGGDLPSKPAAPGAPRFLVWAIKDPNGANLDRVQIIKVWAKNGRQFDKIFDVALSNNRSRDPKTRKVPAVGNTVNLATATYSNTIGSVELSSSWEDPEFDSAATVAYYVRVIEIPTPRWTTTRAVQAGVALPTVVPPTLQERAWTSPIWYSPKR